MSEVLQEKYGKSHVLRVKTIGEFQKQVVEHQYPVVIMFYKEYV